MSARLGMLLLHAPATGDRARRAARTKRTRAHYETSFGQTGMCSLPLRPMIEQLSSFTARALLAPDGQAFR